MPNSHLTQLREISDRLDYCHSQISDFFEMAPDLLGIMRSDGYLEMKNRYWRIILGWSNEELSERPLIHFVHHADIGKFRDFLIKLENNESLSCVCRLQRKDSRFVKVEFSASGWCQGRSNIIGRVVEPSYLKCNSLTDEGNKDADLNQDDSR